MSCLTGLRVPESLQKYTKSKYDQITWFYVPIKTLNQKVSGGKKFIYYPRILIQKENLKLNILWGHSNSDISVQNAQTLLQKRFSIYKILVPWKNKPLPIPTSRDNRGSIMPPPLSFLFVKYPHPLRVNLDLQGCLYCQNPSLFKHSVYIHNKCKTEEQFPID